MLKTRAGATVGTSGPDPDYITTIEAACAVIGGTKPISLPTLYRDPELKALIEHPSSGRLTHPAPDAARGARRRPHDQCGPQLLRSPPPLRR